MTCDLIIMITIESNECHAIVYPRNDLTRQRIDICEVKWRQNSIRVKVHSIDTKRLVPSPKIKLLENHIKSCVSLTPAKIQLASMSLSLLLRQFKAELSKRIFDISKTLNSKLN